MELILSDMEHLERRIDKVKKMLKGDKTLAPQLELYERIMTALSDGKCAPHAFEFSDSDRELDGGSRPDCTTEARHRRCRRVRGRSCGGFAG